MKAVITAGAPIEGEYANLAGTARKALAPIGATTMLERTLDVLAALRIERIAVVGDDEIARCCATRDVRMIADRASGAGNVHAALGAWPEDGEPLLYLTCDMPFLDAPALDDFLARSPHAALTMPLAEHAAFVRRFPGAPPFGIVLAGERVVNGGAFVLPPGACARVADVAARLFDARKAPWKMAAIAGLPLLLRFAAGRLDIPALEGRARDLLGIEVRAVRGCAPELGYDADTADEYRYARERA